MNPLSHHQIGQATHREYEARYGNHYIGDETGQKKVSPFNRHRLVVALSGLAVISAIVTFTLLF